MYDYALKQNRQNAQPFQPRFSSTPMPSEGQPMLHNVQFPCTLSGPVLLIFLHSLKCAELPDRSVDRCSAYLLSWMLGPTAFPSAALQMKPGTKNPGCGPTDAARASPGFTGTVHGNPNFQVASHRHLPRPGLGRAPGPEVIRSLMRAGLHWQPGQWPGGEAKALGRPLRRRHPGLPIPFKLAHRIQCHSESGCQLEFEEAAAEAPAAHQLCSRARPPSPTRSSLIRPRPAGPSFEHHDAGPWPSHGGPSPSPTRTSAPMTNCPRPRLLSGHCSGSTVPSPADRNRGR